MIKKGYIIYAPPVNSLQVLEIGVVSLIFGEKK